MTHSKKERLKIIDHILNGVEEYWMDQTGRIYSTNLEAITITGYEEHEMIGQHFSVLYRPEDIKEKQPEKDLAEVLTSGSVVTKGVRMKKNKLIFLALIKFERTMRENGEHGIKMLVQDTTYKAVQKHKLKRAESHFDSLFHNNFIGVIHLNQDTLRILSGNNKAADIIGDVEIVGKDFRNYIRTDESIYRFDELLRSKVTDDFEMQLFQRNGNTCHVRMQCSYFSSEELIEVLIFDITNEKKTIEELERTNLHLDQFIYHASHDLRSPLTTIMGLLQISKKENVSIEVIHSYLDLMTERTRHLDGLLIDLTSIAYNEKAELQLEKINFETEVEAILSEHRPLNPAIHYHVNISQPYRFFSDVKRLRSILRNLISNAIKYYNPTQKTPYVQLSILVKNDHTFIEVADNGIGIHPQHVDQIFSMFFRATDRSSGSGLGLYIVKAMLSKLNGDIKVASAPWAGSTFSLRIPNLGAVL